MAKKSKTNVPKLCLELQELQKQRAWYIKTKNMLHNRLRATVAGSLGYETAMTEKDRRKKFKEADARIKSVINDDTDDENTNFAQEEMVRVIYPNILVAQNAAKAFEKRMIPVAEKLPMAYWVNDPDQKGFSILGMAILIGETGDLCNYANPGKVWRRMGCAPYTKNDETLMGKTWKNRQSGKNGTKLHKSDWEEFGYNPRRRSIAYIMGENLLKHNFMDKEHKIDGPYRERYQQGRDRAVENNPEWIVCSICKGTKKSKSGKGKCTNCGGSGEVSMHIHLHGMLLATKLLMKNLWIEWNGRPDFTPNWK